VLGAYNRVLASGVCASGFLAPIRAKAHLHLIFLVGWATMHERGGARAVNPLEFVPNLSVRRDG
jgi:hypothetical protein